MERAVDKLIVAALSAVAAIAWTEGPAIVVGALAALLVSALAEAWAGRPAWLRAALLAVACAACLIWPPLACWLPLWVYDLALLGRVWPLAAVAALLGCAGRLGGPAAAGIALVGGVAVVLAWRTERAGAAMGEHRRLRDQLAAESQRLAWQNADLAERRELEVRLATTAERARIAREIHDNAGHLLTRSLLQVKALAVADPALESRLAPVAATLDEAMGTIRESVHHLHDDALDLEADLSVLGAGTDLRVTVDYQAGPVPAPVSRAFAAIAREAVANALRHSDATAVSVSVADRPGFYQLAVHDNGSVPGGSGRSGGSGGTMPTGRDHVASASSSGPGIGLRTMEERVRILGGVLNAGFADGFRVFASVPKHGPVPDRLAV
ncbi:MAG: histidine kinase, partial [Bifidobacteriaceae bacterium]|nr:histidine kinase [Bifidobacteriaceae bacterium]